VKKRLIIKFEDGTEIDATNPPSDLDDETIGIYIADTMPYYSADYFIRHYYGEIYLEAIELIDRSRRNYETNI
jgi:hypothetical protein